MSIFTNIKGLFVTTEADVQTFMMNVWNELPVVEAEIAKAAGWIVKSGLPSLTAEVQAITPFVSVLGTAAGHPELAANMAALNVAMAGVQSFAATAASGSLTADQVVAGYGSLKQAGSAAQQVVSTAAAIVAVTPATKAA
jgi:hypothetical protein